MAPLSGLSELHRDALDEAVAFVKERYAPWAILAAGSIVRGQPDPASDIDLYVLHDAPFRQRVQRWFSGVPTEVFVNPEAAVRAYLEAEAREGRPFTAHMIATGVALLGENSARLRALRRIAQASLDDPPRRSKMELVRGRYAAATLLEDALDKRETDPETAMRLLGKAMEAATSYWFMRLARHHPRHKDVLIEIESEDAELGHLCRRFWGDGSLSDRWDAALAIADRVLEARGFFEWESEQDPVRPVE